MRETTSRHWEQAKLYMYVHVYVEALRRERRTLDGDLDVIEKEIYDSEELRKEESLMCKPQM